MMCLDIGCSSGGFDEILENRISKGSWIQNHFGYWIGIDIDRKKILCAKNVIDANFMIADAKMLPFQNMSFDVVHSAGTLHHMDDYHGGLSEMSRVCEVGGMLYLFEVVNNNLFYSMCRKISKSWKGDAVLSTFSSDDILDILKKDFHIMDVKYFWRSVISDIIFLVFGKEPIASLRINKFVGDIFDKIGFGKVLCCHLVVVAKRR